MTEFNLSEYIYTPLTNNPKTILNQWLEISDVKEAEECCKENKEDLL